MKSSIINSMKNSIILVVIISFGLAPTNLYSSKNSNESLNINNEAQLNLPSNTIALFTILLLSLHANKEGKNLTEQCEPSILLKNFTEVYSTLAVTSLAHEFGHAITSYFLNNNPMDIHIGSLNSNQQPLFKMGPISIDSLNPMVGYARTGVSNSKANELMTLAAGPLGGIIGYYLFKIIKCFSGQMIDHTSTMSIRAKLKSSIKSALTKKSSLDSIALGHLLYLIIPMGSSGDGSKIWKLLGADPDTVDSLGKVGPLFIYLLPSLFALKTA